MDKCVLSDRNPQSLEEWAELLREEELPIFSNTAQKIYAALDDKKKGAMELASIILQDPNLTAKLLKVGNSPYYNPSRQKISTVSRAIVILGMQMIRELTLACSFFESILSPANKERANREIAQAIHAAVQARELAIALADASPEEVFVAALLHNVGQVAFWCSGDAKAALLHERLVNSEIPGEAGEKQILGFCLDDLGKKLSKSWHLGGLIHDAISHPQSLDKRVQTVRLGSEISSALEQGIDSDAMRVCFDKLEKLGFEAGEPLRAKIKSNTLSAIDIAHQFGAYDASVYIGAGDQIPAREIIEDVKPDKKQIQFQILQDIAAHISGNIELNTLFEMVLEGIHRGVEMDHTLFLLLGPDKKVLNEKIALGWAKIDSNAKLHIYQEGDKGNFLFHALHDREGVWIKPQQHQELYSLQIENCFGRHECFVFPVQLESKPIGLIYCDRGLSGAALKPEDFSAAKHFARQAQIGLTLYRMQNH